MSKSYPKPISNWEGIPNNIDDALRYSNGYTYFFKDGQYWRFDDASFKVRIESRNFLGDLDLKLLFRTGGQGRPGLPPAGGLLVVRMFVP